MGNFYFYNSWKSEWLISCSIERIAFEFLYYQPKKIFFTVYGVYVYKQNSHLQYCKWLFARSG